MIVCGIYEDHVYLIDGSGIDAGMDCCHILNPAQFYFDDKVVLPLSMPGIVRTSKLKNMVSHGNGVSESCGYGDPSNATLEINSLSEVYNYQFVSSGKKGYEKQNLLIKRFLGFTDSGLSFGLASYNTSVAALTNVLNSNLVGNISVFVEELCNQLDTTRYLRKEKHAWYIKVTDLIDTLEKVNVGEMTRKEAASKWQHHHHAKAVVVELTTAEIKSFTFEHTTIWNEENA